MPGLLQAGLGGGLLVWLYVRLLMHHRQDRTEHRAELAAVRQQHAKEMTGARARIAELEQLLETEKRRRWEVEEAHHRRQLGLPTVNRGVDGDQQGT